MLNRFRDAWYEESTTLLTSVNRTEMGDTVDVRHRATALMGPEIFHQAISQKELDSATDAASWRLLMAVSLMESSYLRIVVCSRFCHSLWKSVDGKAAVVLFLDLRQRALLCGGPPKIKSMIGSGMIHDDVPSIAFRDCCKMFNGKVGRREF